MPTLVQSEPTSAASSRARRRTSSSPSPSCLRRDLRPTVSTTWSGLLFSQRTAGWGRRQPGQIARLAPSGQPDKDATPAPTGAAMRDGVGSLVAVVLFDGFELLDAFGPLELFGALPDRFTITLVGPDTGPVRSAQGPRVLVDHGYDSAPVPDIVLVPGGIGTRRLVDRQPFLTWLRAWAAQAALVASVCTGSGLLAAAGLLDGYRATSNKRVFSWAVQQGPHVEWEPQARWVEDRDRWTSSGIAAGLDMAVALIASLHGEDVAADVAARLELEPHRDPAWDPFAALNGVGPPAPHRGPGAPSSADGRQ
jgi:putative intracellular protease/amidase